MLFCKQSVFASAITLADTVGSFVGITLIVLCPQLNIPYLNLLPFQADNSHGFGVYLIESLDKLVGVLGTEPGIECSGLVQQLHQLFRFFIGLFVLHYPLITLIFSKIIWITLWCGFTSNIFLKFCKGLSLAPANIDAF
jgi:hypothetical protein